MLELKYIFKYVRDLLTNTTDVWTRLRNDDKLNEGKFDYLFQHYYLPMMGVGAICIFLLYGLGFISHSVVLDDSGFDLEVGLKGMVLFVVAYISAVPLATLIIKETFDRLFEQDTEKNKLEVFAGYCVSLVMLVELVCAFLSQLSFLTFAGLYVIYVVWVGAALYLEIENRRLWFFTVVAFLSIYCAPIAIKWLLTLLLRF